VINRRFHRHTGRAPARRLQNVFHGQGLCPPGLNEDDPDVTTMAIVVADELDGTYEILGR
jgi:hypothetical protein